MGQAMANSRITSPTNDLPHFHILCMHTQAAAAFKAAIEKYPDLASKISYETHESSLSMMGTNFNFDLVVSPANSYGLLDGGFDDAISRAFSPKDEYYALTRHVQVDLYKEYKGYLPPGSSHIVKMPEEWKVGEDGKSRLRYGDGKGWGCKWIAMVPTMRVPVSLDGDEEIVYRCVWSLFVSIDKHNRDAREEDRINSILMTPLGTGVGGVTYEKWAIQCVLAIKHWIEACEGPEEWSQIDWPTADRIDREIEATTTTTM